MLSLRELLLEPNVRGVNVDDPRLLAIHRENVLRKKLLQSAFKTFYLMMAQLCDAYFKIDGLEVELGSGAGFFKKVRPGIMTSDVRDGSGIDCLLDATNLDLEETSVRCIYMINVFHHIPNPELFFQELIRVLKPGGGAILVEPHNGFFSSFLHKRLHKTEYFDPCMEGWQSTATGPLSGANQALMHIVFERDREIFQQLYGTYMGIEYSGYVPNSLRYLLSGGVNFRSLVPPILDIPIQIIEKMLMPFARVWSLHKIIVIRKKFDN